MNQEQLSFSDIGGNFPRLEIIQPGVPTGNGPWFVRRVICGDGQRNQCIDDPTWAQIEDALSKLDGRHDLLLEGQSAFPYLVIGGGRDGKYLVAVSQEKAIYFLSDPRSEAQDTFSVILGGQSSEYPAYLGVSGEMAMQAAWGFVERGILLPSFCWVEDA